jgi:16S rRNA (guanine966-N2)-methyltransferase
LTLRIIAGKWRGRRIAAPPGKNVRPTLDRVREAWMSIVQPRLAGGRVLDLFAGSGALGLEALSRGAMFADIVERDPRTFRVLQQNVATLEADAMVRLHRTDALRFVAAAGQLEYQVAFADPPYETGAADAVAEAWLRTPFASVLGIEHAPREKLPGEPDSRRYGSSVVSFYYFPAP